MDDRHRPDQILVYAMHAGVQWVVLTDGDEYRVYNAHAVVPFEEKLFRSVRLSDEGARTEELLELIAKERMRENWIDTLWKAHFVDRQIRASEVIQEVQHLCLSWWARRDSNPQPMD